MNSRRKIGCTWVTCHALIFFTTYLRSSSCVVFHFRTDRKLELNTYSPSFVASYVLHASTEVSQLFRMWWWIRNTFNSHESWKYHWPRPIKYWEIISTEWEWQGSSRHSRVPDQTFSVIRHLFCYFCVSFRILRQCCTDVERICGKDFINHQFGMERWVEWCVSVMSLQVKLELIWLWNRTASTAEPWGYFGIEGVRCLFWQGWEVIYKSWR